MAQQQNPQQNAAAETEQDINILKKIRMDKLAELQAAGNDPFTITKYDVTAHAADLKADYEATEARLKEAANGDEEAFPGKLRTAQGTNRFHRRQNHELERYGTCKLH